MSEPQRFAASLVALAISLPVTVAVAVFVFGLADGDAVWLGLLSWALACAWRDTRRRAS